VEPGEYRERLFLKDGIRLVSRVPRGATIRLPGTTADSDFVPAVVADRVSHAELTGFRIIGDAATPFGVGVGITGSDLSVIDVEILGATRAGIEFGENSSATLLGSEIHDNPGAAIFVRHMRTRALQITYLVEMVCRSARPGVSSLMPSVRRFFSETYLSD